MRDPNPHIKRLEARLWALERQTGRIRKRLYEAYAKREKFEAQPQNRD